MYPRGLDLRARLLYALELETRKKGKQMDLEMCQTHVSVKGAALNSEEKDVFVKLSDATARKRAPCVAHSWGWVAGLPRHDVEVGALS